MLNPTFQKNYLAIVVDLLSKHKIKNAYIFGSAVTERFNDKSDIDLLINFDEGLDPLERGELIWSLQFALEDNLNREIDLLTEPSLRNPYFIQSINQNKQLIYEH
jgi:uncharacterized protein